MITILTGPVHAGKTSFLEEITAEFKQAGFRIGGYLSVALWDDVNWVGYDLYDIVDEDSAPFIRKSGEKTWQKIGEYFFIPEAFNRVEAILRRDQSSDLIVVDEVGPLELSGKGVWPFVEELISDPARRIVLVIRESILDAFLRMLEGYETRVVRFEDPDVFEQMRLQFQSSSGTEEDSDAEGNVYEAALKKMESAGDIVLATVVDAEGSAPQIPGASALFSGQGLLWGTVGGGLVEGEVQARAMENITNGRSAVLRFDLDAISVEEVGGICGGRMTVLLDAKTDRHTDTFRSVVNALAGRTRGVLATWIRSSADGVDVSRIWVEASRMGADLAPPFAAHVEDVKRIFRTGRAACIHIDRPERTDESTGDEETLLFCEPISPRFRLIIAGAGHVGRAVSHLGRLLDFEVSVIDDRSEFANASNLPDAHRILVGDIASQLEELSMDQDTFVVIVTRGHSCDAEALRAVVKSGAGYIGMMGSTTKVALMCKHFVEKSWCTAGEFDSVHTPIGLEIESKTVQEIAVSIAAQLVKIRNSLRGVLEE